MKLFCEPMTLNLRRTFRVAHGASDQRTNVLVRIEQDGLTGYGEAAAVPYYGDTQESLMTYLNNLLSLGNDPFALENVLERLPDGSHAARAGVDIALHDLWGKLVGQPLYRLFGLASRPLPRTSFTIGIDTPEEMARIARESDYPIFKVKLDANDPETSLAAVRKVTDARLRVDANASWTLQQAIETIPRLVQYDLEFVEQPLPPGDFGTYQSLRDELHRKGVTLPIFVDESVKTSRDVAKYAGAVDGIIVKLMKTGGLREAIRTIHTARSHDMQIMLSCMVESSVGVTAAAHIGSLCDYLDLDGPLLIANDPFEGVKYDGANLSLSNNPGLGGFPVNS
jgi:L-alanine-DL-glutamate epimerase-like enolase superfamily enzyme